MAQVTIAWDTTSQNFPAGTVAGNFQVDIVGGAIGTTPVSMTVPASPAVFPDIPAEADTDPDYQVTVQRLDGAGQPLGSPATASFRVAGGTSVAVDIPNTVTVTVA